MLVLLNSAEWSLKNLILFFLNTKLYVGSTVVHIRVYVSLPSSIPYLVYLLLPVLRIHNDFFVVKMFLVLILLPPICFSNIRKLSYWLVFQILRVYHLFLLQLIANFMFFLPLLFSHFLFFSSLFFYTFSLTCSLV